MNLIWHIVRKDFRRLRLPLAIWLVLVLASALLASGLLDYYRTVETGVAPGNYRVSRPGVGLSGENFLVLVQVLLGYILAAWLAMEDSLPGTQAFWQTRPISGVRLLAAKGLGALLMFGVLPVAVLTPVWLGLDFSFLNWTTAASETLLLQGGIAILAISLASVSASANQLILLSLALAMAMTVLSAIGPTVSGYDPTPPGLVDSRLWVIGYLVVALPPVVMIHQFLTRRTAVSLLIVIIGLVLMPTVRLAWPWDFVTPRRQAAAEQTREVAPTVRFERQGRREWVEANGQLHCLVHGVIEGVTEGTVIRVDSVIGEWSKNGQRLAQARFLTGDGHEQAPAAWVVRRLAGIQVTSTPPPRWVVGARVGKDLAATLSDPDLTLHLSIAATVLRGRMLGNLPVRIGAELKAGTDLTRLVGVLNRPTDHGRWQANFQEWDAPSGQLKGVHYPDAPPVRFGPATGEGNEPVTDRYVLQARTEAETQIGSPKAWSTGRIGGIVSRRFTLDFQPPAPEDGNGGAMDGDFGAAMLLTKVRFVAEDGLVRDIEIPAVGSFQP